MKTTHRILLFLRVALHVLVALLLVVGVAGAWGNWPAVALAGAFAAVYLAGTVWHNQGKRFTTTASWAWLAVVVGLWVAMTLAAPTFVWLLFPLVFLVLYLVPAPWGIGAAAAAWLVAVAVTGPVYGVGGVLGPAIGTVLAVVVHYSYRALKQEAEHYRDLAERLAATRAELAETQHEAGVLEERARLSREIHDTLAQGFSSIVLLARAAAKDPDPATLRTIEDTARDNLAQARGLIAGEDPAPEPLAARVEKLAAAARRRQDALGEPLEVAVSAVPDVPEPQASVAERVVREGLSNVTRHARATKAVVTVAASGGDVTVDVFDNGRGLSGPPGFGLTGLRTRVEEAGGSLAVESSSSGTVLAARIPREENP